MSSPGYRWVVLALAALGPIFRSYFGLSLVQVGTLLEGVSKGQLLSNTGWGMLSDRFSERVVLGAGLELAAAGLACWRARNLNKPDYEI